MSSFVRLAICEFQFTSSISICALLENKNIEKKYENKSITVKLIHELVATLRMLTHWTIGKRLRERENEKNATDKVCERQAENIRHNEIIDVDEVNASSGERFITTKKSSITFDSISEAQQKKKRSERARRFDLINWPEIGRLLTKQIPLFVRFGHE